MFNMKNYILACGLSVLCFSPLSLYAGAPPSEPADVVNASSAQTAAQPAVSSSTVNANIQGLPISGATNRKNPYTNVAQIPPPKIVKMSDLEEDPCADVKVQSSSSYAPSTVSAPPQQMQVQTTRTLYDYPVPPDTIYDMEKIRIDKDEVEMREFKVQIRELASQMFETFSGDALQGFAAYPVTFVNLENYNSTSDFGRYIAEALIFELNQRGFPVNDAKVSNKIVFRDDGQFVFKTHGSERVTNSRAVFLVGTYLKEKAGIFVNARLVHNNGDVLRTAQMVLPMNTMLDGMTKAPLLSGGSLPIRGE